MLKTLRQAFSYYIKTISSVRVLGSVTTMDKSYKNKVDRTICYFIIENLNKRYRGTFFTLDRSGNPAKYVFLDVRARECF